LRGVRYATALAVGALYFWIIGIGAVHERFTWDSGLEAFYGLPDHPIPGSDAVNGYYDLLARSFVAGNVRLPLEPSPALLALPDPFSDQVNRPFRLLDAVLYNRHYYLYHGATPALLLFTPWYLLTKQDLPENFTAFLLTLGGYLFLAALYTDVLTVLSIRLPLGLYTLFLIALGIGQSVPFLLQRAKVYEVAIAGGYFFLSCGFYFLFKLLAAGNRPTLYAAVSGISFGLAMGCRPHMGLAAASVFVLLLLLPAPFTEGTPRLFRWLFRSDVLAFTIPVVLCGLAIAAYNYLRFDNPLEFGTRYLLGGDTYRNFRLSITNIARGLYYLLVSPPDLVPEFPFVRLALRGPFNAAAIPPDYFLEPIAGALSLCPLGILAPVMLMWRKPWTGQRVVFGFLAAMFVCVVGTVLILASVPFSTQRYEVDFLPYLLFIACVAAAVLLRTLRRKGIRIAAVAVVTAALLYSITANVALGIQGPYDEFVQGSSHTYVDIARWFSPVARFRPVLNPSLHMQAAFEFRTTCPPRREPLLSAGEFGSRYLLTAECAGAGRIRLISQTAHMDPDVRMVELPLPGPGWYTAGLDFTADNRIMSVTWNHQVVLQHHLRFLVTAPSQIHFGWDSTFGYTKPFDWQMVPATPRFVADPVSPVTYSNQTPPAK
jgi:hypothetical protein